MNNIINKSFQIIFLKFISLVVGIITTKYIIINTNQSIYGSYLFLLSIVGTLGLIVDFGTSVYFIKHYYEDRSNNAILNFLHLRFLLVIIFILLTLINSFFILKTELIYYSLIIILAYVIYTFSSTFNVILQAKNQVLKIGLYEVYSRSLFFIAFFILVNRLTPLYSLVLSYLFSNLFSLCIQIVINYRSVLNQLKLFLFIRKQKNNYQFMKFDKKYFYIGLVTVLSYGYFKTDQILIGYLLKPSDLANYGFSYKIIDMLITFWGLFMMVVYPQLANIFNRDKKVLRKYILKLYLFAFLYGMLSIISSLFLGNHLIRLLADSSYIQSNRIISLLSLMLPFLFINNINYFTFVLYDKYISLIKIYFFTFLVNISINVLFIPNYGLIAPIFASLISELIIFLLFYLNIKKLLYKP